MAYSKVFTVPPSHNTSIVLQSFTQSYTIGCSTQLQLDWCHLSAKVSRNEIQIICKLGILKQNLMVASYYLFSSATFSCTALALHCSLAWPPMHACGYTYLNTPSHALFTCGTCHSTGGSDHKHVPTHLACTPPQEARAFEYN